MTKKQGWEESTKAPDWIDVEGYLRAMSVLHSGHVGFHVSPLGPGFNGGLQVSARMEFDVLPGSSLPPTVEVARGWPCTQHAQLAGHVLALLYELDYAVAKVYNQSSLWE